jgi:hypothetical protein
LLRIDVKLSWIMIPLGIWAWLMHFFDMAFNVQPIHNPHGFVLHWMDLSCMAFIGGVLAWVFLKYLNSHPIIPQKDPRFAEAMDIYVESDQYVEAATARGINHGSGGAK